MKSDREFLNGVYEKAHKLTKEKEKTTQVAVTRIPKGMLAAAIALIIVIPVSLRIHSVDTRSGEDRMGIASVKEGPRSSQGYSNGDSAGEDLDSLTYLVEDSQLVLGAKVIDVREKVLFQVTELYKGEFVGSELSLKNQGQLGFSEGEEVLLFLKTDENDALRLNENYCIKYTFYETRNGEKIFISQDRREVSSETIKIIISGGMAN